MLKQILEQIERGEITVTGAHGERRVIDADEIDQDTGTLKVIPTDELEFTVRYKEAAA